jgi:predicted kinase
MNKLQHAPISLALRYKAVLALESQKLGAQGRHIHIHIIERLHFPSFFLNNDNTHTMFQFIVSGNDSSGKTRFASELARALGGTHIEDDTHRYVPGSNWTKKPTADFIASVHEAAANANATRAPVILDCGYNDVLDPERAMKTLMDEAVRRAPADAKPVVVVLTMGSLHEAVEALLARSIGRATGAAPPGACEETLANKAGLLIKFVQNYEANMAALDAFATRARAVGCVVHTGSYESVRAAFIPA